MKNPRRLYEFECTQAEARLLISALEAYEPSDDRDSVTVVNLAAYLEDVVDIP